MNLSGKELVLQTRQTLNRLSTPQKTTLAALIVAGIAAVSMLLWWSARPDYVVLFSSLNEHDGGRVLNYLQESNIPYLIEMGGATIKVPREKVYETRLKLANMGLPEQKGTGYELFDKVNFGMSDFMQKLNYRRALEGELARTIIALEEVEAARVHLVMPEQALFAEKERSITASVALKLKPNKSLSESQVQGVAFLVAGAVEGLKIENVTIVDSKGNILTNLLERDPAIALTSNQLQVQKQVENQMQSNVQSMLDKLLGPNRSIVRVNAKLDFKRIEEQRELYDNQNPAIRSEERNEATSSGGSVGTTNTENTVTNYEVSRTVQKIQGASGGIQKLSLAVIVDGAYKRVGTGSDSKQEYTPRTQQEMLNLSNAIRGAVGYDETRGDRLEISNIPFDVSHIDEQNEEFRQTERMEFWRMIVERGVLVIGVIVILFMIRGYLRRTSKATEDALERTLVELRPAPQQLPPGAVGSVPGQPGALPSGEIPSLAKRLEEASHRQVLNLDTGLPDEVIALKQLQDQLAEFAIEKPENAARLLKTWLIEG